MWALGALDEHRITADGSKRPHGAVHATDQHSRSSIVQLARSTTVAVV
jgi:hypothetical protein